MEKKQEKAKPFTMNVGAKEFVPSFKKTPTTAPVALIVTVSKNGDDPQEINVKSSDKIFDAILKEFEYELEDIQAIYLGDSHIYPDNTFEEEGIQDGARLNLILEYSDVAYQKKCEKCEKWLNDIRREHPNLMRAGTIIRHNFQNNRWEIQYGAVDNINPIGFNADDIGCSVLASYLDENERWEKFDDNVPLIWGFPPGAGTLFDAWFLLRDLPE